jgi:hypothetical protein
MFQGFQDVQQQNQVGRALKINDILSLMGNLPFITHYDFKVYASVLCKIGYNFSNFYATKTLLVSKEASVSSLLGNLRVLLVHPI